MKPTTINDRIRRIKSSEEDINALVEEYKPFIAACTERATGRYVRYGEDDELSISMMAFVESVKSYDSGKGSFLSFAQNVIKRRLIDYFRKEKKHSGILSLNEYSSEEGEEMDLSEGQAVEVFTEEEISEYRRMELEELKKELKNWDISFLELVEASPKHDKTRKTYKEIIKYLIARDELVKQIKQKKFLPVADIEKNTGIPRKTVERARKYIIAAVIIITGDYQYVRDYVDWR